MAKRNERKAVENFMEGVSFEVTPLLRLKMIAASSIFGEPSYYRDVDAKVAAKVRVPRSRSQRLDESCYAQIKKYLVMPELYDPKDQRTTDQVFVEAIDQALTYDFGATLKLAETLRTTYRMRLNPAVIYIRAALHPNRVNFNKSHPKVMRTIGQAIVQRPDDMTNQLRYYLAIKGKKNHLPNVVKRTWVDNLTTTSRYQLKKYLNQGKLIDLVRICHAHSPDIDEMMKTGDVKVDEDQMTWETLRSGGMSWTTIIQTIRIPHMALLRNLRNLAKELGVEEMQGMLEQLENGVEGGKQFPFRYFTAYRVVEKEVPTHKKMILASLERCMNQAMKNFPRLKGNTICLTDNSGSAHGTVTSQYGSVKVANIANLSGVMTAINSEKDSEVGVFGDTLKYYKVDKKSGVLEQADAVNTLGCTVGGGTENGIWIFFRDALRHNMHYDNIFIYSDMQAGHGGLYGCRSNEYKDYVFGGTRRYGSEYIDVLKLVEAYRKKVNPKVNVFSVQVAGYDNSVLPETLYRGAILSGWTGNEVTYAKTIIDLWDQLEASVLE